MNILNGKKIKSKILIFISFFHNKRIQKKYKRNIMRKIYIILDFYYNQNEIFWKNIRD